MENKVNCPIHGVQDWYCIHPRMGLFMCKKCFEVAILPTINVSSSTIAHVNVVGTTSKPHKCPACDGQGTTMHPPWVAGDQQFWVGGGNGPWPCQACNGTGIIWSFEVAVNNADPPA
jgi:hypothetical protein